MAKKVQCKKCGKDVTDEAIHALGEALAEQYGGYNPISISYAPPPSADLEEQFLANYVCKQCIKGTTLSDVPLV